MMEVNKLCRLCGTTKYLRSIFEYSSAPESRNAIIERIHAATGIHIREDDVVSKMICRRCCEIVVKLHRYRIKAVTNDKYLKELCGQPYVAPITDSAELRKISAQILASSGKMSSSCTTLSNGRFLLVDTENAAASREALELLSFCVKQEPVDNSSTPKPEPYKHESVKNLYIQFPDILLPKSVYKCDIAPVISLDRDEVEQWAEEEFERVQQKLSLAKIKIQKVGESSSSNNKHVETTENEHEVNNALLIKKRPGPKSKTLDILLPPVVQIKRRPGPKSKTIDLISNSAGIELKEKPFNDEGTYSKPEPESLNVVSYKPGPKSRKADLAICSTVVKPVAREIQTIRSIEEPPLKLIKLQRKSNKMAKTKEDSIKIPKAKNEASSSSQTAVANQMLNGNPESDNDNFDSNNLFLDDDSFYDSPSSEEEVRHSKKTNIHDLKKHKVNNSIRELHSQPSTTYNNNETKRNKRPPHSYKRSSSSESEESNESAKRQKTNSKSENNNKSGSKIKNGQLDLSTKTAKADTTKSIRHKPDIDKNIGKDHLFKKNKSEITKSPLCDKKESTKLNNKKVQNFSTFDKQEPDKQQTKKQESSKREPSKINAGKSTHQKENDEPPSLVIGKAQKIYMCHTCCKLHDTQKELSEHQKQHLICQFCNYRMKNVETLKSHQKNNCRMNIHRLQLRVKLTKVEAIKSIVSQYPKAFDSKCNSKNDNTTTSDVKTEIQSPSEEIDVDIEYLEGSHEINLLPKSFLELPLNGMSENEMIRSLFAKHLTAGVLKLNRVSQTFLPQPTDVSYTSNNLIILHNLFNELYTYKIPVELEIRPKIGARFTTQLVVTPHVKRKIECWSHIKPVIIRKPSTKPVVLAPKPLWTAAAKLNSASLSFTSATVAPVSLPLINANVIGTSKYKLSLLPNPVIPSTLWTNGKIANFSKYTQPSLSMTQTPAVLNSSTNASVSESTKLQISSPVLPTPPALVGTSNPAQTDTNALVLNNLLSSSPSVPSSPHLLTNSNIFLSTNTSFIPSDKSPALVSVLATSSVPTTNVTTTLIQTSSNDTLFIPGGLSPNSTTIIQTPNNATLIQTPNAAIIQANSSTAFINSDSTLEVAQSNVSRTINSIAAPVSSQSSLVLMPTVPQVTNQPTIGDQASINTINSNNLVLQSPAEQIYQINNTAGDVNKVVVLSNTLVNNLSQQEPLGAIPYVSNDFPSLNLEPSSVSIEEIDNDPQKNGNASSAKITTIQNKSTTILRIKPNWELY